MKIHQQRIAVPINQYVGRLDVQMQHPPVMRVLQGPCQVQDKARCKWRMMFPPESRSSTVTVMGRKFTVSDGIPADAGFDRFEVRDDGVTLRVWFASRECEPGTQFTPMLTAVTG